MTPVWGVDGCRSGWIGVWIDGKRRGFALSSDAAAFDALDAKMSMIDVPIGLPDRGYRGCDLAARKLLRGAPSRIFLGLRRPLLAHLADYREANARAKADGAGLSRQAFAILPKVAAIDAIMTPARQRRVRESHPELVFWRLNGGAVLSSKHTRAGLRMRRKLLVDRGFTEIDSWLGALPGGDANADDLFDACALALAAQQATQGCCYRVKCDPAADAAGLRMNIWF